MKNKALILYASLTGNTELVAKTFADTCRDYNLLPTMVKVHPKYDWASNPIHFEDYDLVCFGSPIMAGLPYHELTLTLGLQGKRIDFHGKTPDGRPHESICPGTKDDPFETVYGVVFATYGGVGVGPKECEATLAILEEYCRVNGVRAVGRFACPGKQLRHSAVDGLCIEYGFNNDEAQAMIQRYKDDPNATEFASLDQKLICDLKKAAAAGDDHTERIVYDNDPLGCGMPGSLFWHYDLMNRPSERDLTKAKIFLAELIEDYFLTSNGVPRSPYSMYTSIS